MATKYGTPIDFWHTRQLRVVASQLSINWNLSTTRAALISAIKAK